MMKDVWPGREKHKSIADQKKNVFIAWGRKTYGAFEIIQHQVMGFERGWRGREKEWGIYLDIIILLLKSFKLGSDRLTSVF